MKCISKKSSLSFAAGILLVAASQTVAGATLRLMPVGDSITSGSQVTGNNGYYQIKNANSALNVNVAGASTANGGLIVQHQFGGVTHEQWLPVRNSDGSYILYNRNSGLVLDNPGGNTRDTQFNQWGINGGGAAMIAR